MYAPPPPGFFLIYTYLLFIYLLCVWESVGVGVRGQLVGASFPHSSCGITLRPSGNQHLCPPTHLQAIPRSLWYVLVDFCTHKNISDAKKIPLSFQSGCLYWLLPNLPNSNIHRCAGSWLLDVGFSFGINHRVPCQSSKVSTLQLSESPLFLLGESLCCQRAFDFMTILLRWSMNFCFWFVRWWITLYSVKSYLVMTPSWICFVSWDHLGTSLQE